MALSIRELCDVEYKLFYKLNNFGVSTKLLCAALEIPEQSPHKLFVNVWRKGRGDVTGHYSCHLYGDVP